MGSKLMKRLASIMLMLMLVLTSGAMVFAESGSSGSGSETAPVVGDSTTSGNYSKKTMKVVARNTKNCVKYKYYYRKKGGSWKTATSTSTSYTFKKLTKSGLYEFKVAGIDKNGNEGAATTPSYRYIAKTSVTKATAGKGKVTVKWKKYSGATGYRIQYSTSSKFSNPSTVTVGKVTSKTISGLTKGKYYYFRVTPLKKSGNTYVGIESTTKKSGKVK